MHTVTDLTHTRTIRSDLPPDPFCAKREDDDDSGDEKKEETKSKTNGTGNATSTDAKAKDTKDEVSLWLILSVAVTAVD